MQRFLLVLLLGCVLLSLVSAAPRRNRDKKNKDRQGRREQQQPEDPTTEPESIDPESTGQPPAQETIDTEEDPDPQCTPWNWGECQPLDGECGRGVKLGVRIGEGCKKTQKEKACTLRCGGGKKGGRRKGKQKQDGKQEQDEEEEQQAGESRAETDSPVTETIPTTEEAQEEVQAVVVQQNEPCSPWVWTVCDPVEGGACGKGFKIGTRGGPGCKGNTLKQKPCYVPCPGKGKKPKQAQEQKGRPQTPQEDEEDEDRDPRCTPWSYSSCEPLTGYCGKGVKIGTRSGPKCKKTEKEKDCRVPCGNGNGGGGKKKGGGRQKQKDQPRPYDDPEEEEEVEITGKNGKKICKYRRGDWSECDEAKNQQTRTMVLKKGDTDICPNERYINKPCDRIQRKKERKLDCRYGAGDWGLCNTTSGMRMRVDILEDKGMEIEGCRTQRIVYKKCAAACEYEYGEWSSCDPLSQQRRLEGTLLLTEDTPPDCEPTDTKTKPCFGRNGREKCFFGPWSDYSPCINGYKYRMRELIAGGKKCELQASHAVKCKDNEIKE